MSTRSGIIAGGNWIVDKTKIIDTYPSQDALANILSETVGNGGASFNLLVDLAKLGATFPLAGIGLVGQDGDGSWIQQVCADHQIDATRLLTHPTAHTSYTDVMSVMETGRRTFFHQRGANAFLGAEHFQFEDVEAKIFHLGYLLLLDRLDLPDPEFGTVAARVLKHALDAGLKTCIDVVSEDGNRFSSVVLPALPFVDYCILNELEAERTTGVRIRLESGAIDRAALENAAADLLSAGVREWVIIHYPEAVYAGGKNGRKVRQGSVKIPQEKIAGTTGAGDAFAAGVLLRLHEGASMEDCLIAGVCAAASSLTHPTSSAGLGNLESCLALGEQYGFRD